jgi:NTP pyrophosphatase (non-canonical NTP hydrolase)
MQIHSMQGYEREVKRLLGAHDSEISAYALGLSGEVGEVVDLLKKAWGHGHPLDREKLKKEIGDAMWYVIALALQFGIPVANVTPRRLIDDIGHEHRGQRPLLIVELVSRVVHKAAGFWYRDGSHDLRFPERFARCLRDVFDQLEQLALENGIGLTETLQANVDKLRARYPDGFSAEASIVRVDVVKPIQTTVFPPQGITTVWPETAKAFDRFVALRGGADDDSRPTCTECSIGPNGHQPGCTV